MKQGPGWVLFQEGMAYLARYGNQSRSEIRAMPLHKFAAWIAAVSGMVGREGGVNRG